MTQEALKIALEASNGLKDVLKQVNELVAENKALKEALAQEQWGASAVGHLAYVAEQKRKTEELRSRLESQEPVARLVYKSQGSAGPPARFNAQPEQEPVVVCCQQYDTCLKPCTPRGEHLAQRTWVGLSDDEHCDIWYKESLDWMEYGKAIEAKLRELNT
jgi:hypothetical protein